MKQQVKIGQTDYTVLVLIRDTAGAPKTGMTYLSAGLDMCYVRVETDNDVVLTAGASEVTTLTGVHVDWGFVEVDATNSPGIYKLDIPDGVFASGAWSAVVSIICTGCDPVHLEFVLSTYDLDDIKTAVDALVGDALSDVVEGTYTLQDCMKVLLAYMASKATGGGSPQITFRDTADTKDRIVMAVDGNGNRSAITVDVT